MQNPTEGILLVDKPVGKTAFDLVARLRRITGVKKIGHAGTLDPFATGVMVLLIGREYTKKSDSFLTQEKRYTTTLTLGKATTTYDTEGEVTNVSERVPTQEEVESVIATFQGVIEQIPPMYSAKKIKGKKLYELARKGIEVERAACKVTVSIQILEYNYPHLSLDVTCSKGTYIRSLGHDIGHALGSFAHLSTLRRTQSGPFTIDACFSGSDLYSEAPDISSFVFT